MTSLSEAPATADLTPSVSQWAAAADDLDLLEDLDALLAWLVALRAPSDGVLLGQARSLLLRGHPDRALAHLVAAGLDAPCEDPGRPTWRGAVADACRAGTGDLAAYTRLLSATAAVSQSADGWQLTYLLAGAGRQPECDAAWIDLPTARNRVTALTVSRYAVAKTSARDRLDSVAATTAVVRAVEAFDALAVPLVADPAPALAAAAELVRRDDRSGARLLLEAVTHRHPPIAAVTTALRELDATASEHRRYRRRKGAVIAVAAPVFLYLTVFGLIAGHVAMGAWRRRVRLPGLDLVESQASRILSRQRYDPVTDQVVTSDGQTRVDGVDALGAVLGLFAGALVGVPANQALPDHPVIGLCVALGAVLGLGVAGWAGARELRVAHARRRRDRRAAAAGRARLSEASKCSCWQTNVVVGPFARSYLDLHLTSQSAGGLAGLALSDVSLAACPTTGHLWLVRYGGDRTTLLRGAPPEQAQPDSDLPVGLYL